MKEFSVLNRPFEEICSENVYDFAYQMANEGRYTLDGSLDNWDGSSIQRWIASEFYFSKFENVFYLAIDFMLNAQDEPISAEMTFVAEYKGKKYPLKFTIQNYLETKFLYNIVTK